MSKRPRPSLTPRDRPRDYIEEFLVGWDRGDYDVRSRRDVLKWLRNNFFYAGRAYRGGRSTAAKPPVSWTKSIDALIGYWHEVGIPAREIPAWEAEIDAGIDVPAVARWYLTAGGTDVRRAERFMKFEEVITLEPLSALRDVTWVEPVGVLVERGMGRRRTVELVP